MPDAHRLPATVLTLENKTMEKGCSCEPTQINSGAIHIDVLIAIMIMGESKLDK